jgi:hypothetical protein
MSRVSGIERDRLDRHEFAGDDGHGGEPADGRAGCVLDAQHLPRRLLDFAGRVVDQRLANGWNQRFVGQKRADLVFGQIHIRLPKHTSAD